MKDLIERQAAIDLWDKYHYTIAVDAMRYDTELRQLPSAQPKSGKWIRHNTYHGDDTSGFVDPDWRCSECGKSAMVNEWMLYDLSNFCPNCGTDMREEGDK